MPARCGATTSVSEPPTPPASHFATRPAGRRYAGTATSGELIRKASVSRSCRVGGGRTMHRVDPEDVVATVWPGRQFDIEPLGGGITNHNFKVSFHDDGETIVVRAPGKDTELLGIDRQIESAAA